MPEGLKNRRIACARPFSVTGSLLSGFIISTFSSEALTTNVNEICRLKSYMCSEKQTGSRLLIIGSKVREGKSEIAGQRTEGGTSSRSCAIRQNCI